MEKHTKEKKNNSFLSLTALVIEIAGFAFVLAGIAGIIGTYFDWDLAIKIGGSKTPLLKDYIGNSVIIALGGIIIFFDWLFKKESVKKTIKNNKQYIIGASIIALIAIFFLGKHLIIQLEGGPAMWAIGNKNIESFKLEYQKEEFTDEEKSKMLFRAIQYSPEIVQFLLEENVSPNSKREDGVTALKAACTWGAPGTVEALQEFGAEGECPQY